MNADIMGNAKSNRIVACGTESKQTGKRTRDKDMQRKGFSLSIFFIKQNGVIKGRTFEHKQSEVRERQSAGVQGVTFAT